jgi:DNA helicase HerA-like ATPase
VINFIGLPGLESQQEFVNQLAMALFTWIKKNPASPEAPLQGLFVIDEAKDFVPSGKSTPCKESLIRLAAQARKYGLGLIFATQAPKSIDHNVVANCMNHFYGQANSPAAIQTIEDLIRQKGGSVQDISKLGTGNFYVYSEKINGEQPKAPVKIKTPICLSHHPNSPMDENSVLECARQNNQINHPATTRNM